MKRRQLLDRLAIAATTSTALIACEQTNTSPNLQVGSLPSVKWRMVTSWPKSLDTIYGGATTVCDRVAAMTGGKFTIEPYAAGEIVPGLEVLDAVQNGTAECGHTASYYYVGKNPALAFGSCVPFGLTAQQQNAWYYHGGGLETMHELYSDFNIINFPAGNTGAQMGGWFKKQIESIGDLKGLIWFAGEVEDMEMDTEKRKRLESAGWAVGDASDFLGLTTAEAELVELKVRLALFAKEQRKMSNLSQEALAKKMNSSQSRVAKIESGDPSVSLDLIVRALLTAGTTRQELARVIMDSAL